MNQRFALMLFLVVAVACSPLLAEELGTLKGRFVFDGKRPEPKMLALPGGAKIADESLLIDAKTQGVANIVVTMYGKPGEKLPVAPIDGPISHLKVTEKGLEPRIVMPSPRQVFQVTNADAVKHRVQASTLGNTPINRTLMPGDAVVFRLHEREHIPAQLSDGLHPWMRGYLCVGESFMACSNARGEFSIADLPPGKWTFRVWHEQSGFVEKVKQDDKATVWEKGRITLDIRPGENDLGDILVGAEEFPDK